MFGIGEVGAIIGIADVATRVYLQLAGILQEVKDADDTISSLRNKAKTFHDILKAVGAVTRKRTKNVNINPVSDDEACILWCLKAAVARSESTVAKFEQKLKELGRGDAGKNWLNSAKLQWKLNARGPAIARLECDIQANITGLQLLFTCFLPYANKRLFRWERLTRSSQIHAREDLDSASHRQQEDQGVPEEDTT